MNVTPKIEKAIKKASQLHVGQTRKSDGNIPYVSHVFSVAAILSNYTDDEDIIAAALLHDTIEDTSYTPENLEREFGTRVKDIVMGVTEEKMRDGVKIPWAERKQKYLERIMQDSKESLLVAAADRLHNISSLIVEYKECGNVVWAKFSASPDKQVEFFNKLLAILKEKLDSPIVDELAKACEKAEDLFLPKD